MQKSTSPNRLDQKQVLAWWNRVSYDDWWKTQMPITQKAMAAVINMSGFAICMALKGHWVKNIFPKIGEVIPSIERRSLVFYKGYHWIDPEPERKINKLSKESAWDLWARCETCNGNKFIPLEIDQKPHVACYHCLPPSQFRSIGGKRTQKSLIHQALKKITQQDTMPHASEEKI